MPLNIGRDALLGLAIGDALGVPVEFKDRDYLRKFPVEDMIGYGTHNQPVGTWSDDSSLSFCLAESLIASDYNLQTIADNILKWFNDGFWTAHGRVFDIGGQTRSAIDELTAIFKRQNFEALKHRFHNNEYANGNGALMRILPLAFDTYHLSIEEKFERVRAVCALTHGHIRSAIASLIYIIFAEEIIEGKTKKVSYQNTKKIIIDFFRKTQIPKQEQQKFIRLLEFDIANFKETEIKSDGYVLHTLEASFWCIMRSNNYKDTVLTAVNLGGDTDTTAAVAGGIAGLIYGEENMPINWKENLVKRKEIELLGDKLFKKYFK